MTSYEKSAREIVQLLEELSGVSPDLPDSIREYWKEILKTCTEVKPEWNEAKAFCNQVVTILNRLRGGDADFRQIDRAQGKVSILLGSIHLSQREWQDAAYFFEQGARRLRYWDDTVFESLSYLGKALTLKEETKWSEALETAQKALNSIYTLAIPSKSTSSKRLQERIEQEIKAITRASIEETKQKTPFDSRPIKPKPPEPIPIVSSIAAGLGVITEDSVEDYLFLNDYYRNNADFGVRVVGNSMTGDGVFSGDIALISQQPTVKNGEIAAIVITTPEIEGLGVLKRYYVVHGNRKDRAHWLLESSNPASEHLVVMPSGAKIEAVQNLYAQRIETNKISNPIKTYKDAELTIAGKFVGLVRRVQKL